MSQKRTRSVTEFNGDLNGIDDGVNELIGIVTAAVAEKAVSTFCG